MKKNTRIILSGATVLGIAVGSYFLYKFIKKQAMLKKIAEAQRKRQEQEASLPPEQQSSADNYNPASDVKAIGDMVYGDNFWQYGDEVNAIIIPLSDERTIKLAKAYKQEYKVALYVNLVGEWGWYYTDSVAKLKRLGLTS
jgi:hypothetical protein